MNPLKTLPSEDLAKRHIPTKEQPMADAPDSGGHLRSWMLQKAKPGTCPECGVAHDPEQPHNLQSLFYQYHFYAQFGAWPTWADAMAHCSDAVKQAWTAALAERGIEVES